MPGLGIWQICQFFRNLQKKKSQILTERLYFFSGGLWLTRLSQNKWCSCYLKLSGEKIKVWLPITCQHSLGTWQIHFIKGKVWFLCSFHWFNKTQVCKLSLRCVRPSPYGFQCFWDSWELWCQNSLGEPWRNLFYFILRLVCLSRFQYIIW